MSLSPGASVSISRCADRLEDMHTIIEAAVSIHRSVDLRVSKDDRTKFIKDIESQFGSEMLAARREPNMFQVHKANLIYSVRVEYLKADLKHINTGHVDDEKLLLDLVEDVEDLYKTYGMTQDVYHLRNGCLAVKIYRESPRFR